MFPRHLLVSGGDLHRTLLPVLNDKKQIDMTAYLSNQLDLNGETGNTPGTFSFPYGIGLC